MICTSLHFRGDELYLYCGQVCSCNRPASAGGDPVFETKPSLADDDPKYSVPGHPLLVVIL